MVRIAARLVAPIAIVAVAVTVYLIVHSSLVKHHATTTQSQTTLQQTGTGRRGGHRHARPTFYIVKSGDSLSSIAQKTGVSLSQLATLNPSVSTPPYSLQTGQRLRLRR